VGEAERPVSSQDGAQFPAHARPEAVQTVSPQEGAPASPTSSVTAALRVPAEEDAALWTEEGRCTLAIDGEDVTEACRLRETMTFPRSRLEITFVPLKPLDLGEHTAAVAWLGGRYEWSFTVV
jgi:hypothetical protein